MDGWNEERRVIGLGYSMRNCWAQVGRGEEEEEEKWKTLNILDTFGGLDDSRTAVSSSGFNCMGIADPSR
jgi:hypothetical protein